MKVECAVPSPHARLCIVGHPVFQAGAKVNWVQDEDRVLRNLGLGSMGYGVLGEAWALIPPWAFQKKVHYYPTHVVCPQVSFLLEFEFSCTFLLSQVSVRLTASR